MSMEALAWANRQLTGSSDAKAVLKALAEGHYPGTEICEVRIDRICAETELNEQEVLSATLQLVDRGFVILPEDPDAGFILNLTRPA